MIGSKGKVFEYLEIGFIMKFSVLIYNIPSIQETTVIIKFKILENLRNSFISLIP